MTVSSFRPLAQAKRPLFVGVDVGGTTIKLGLVNDEGATLVSGKIPTNGERPPQEAVQRIKAATFELLDGLSVSRDEVSAIGLGTPGPMDIPSGMILDPSNIPGWRYFPLRDRLAEACGWPVSFANDANAAAYGEYWVGSGRDDESMVMLTLGTGVGGGIILQGMLVHGVNSFGSECGHVVVDSRPDARFCVWGGGQGELEAYASASAVVQRTAEQLQAGQASSLTDRLKEGEELTALMIAQEAEAGDSLSTEIILETARYLGVGVVTLVHTLDPGSVVLGGAMNFGGRETHVGQQFLEAVKAEFRRRAFARSWPTEPGSTLPNLAPMPDLLGRRELPALLAHDD